MDGVSSALSMPRAQQAVGALTECAQVARLDVEQHHAPGGEFEVDVEVELEQSHDPLDALRKKRVFRTEVVQRRKQPRERDQLLVAVAPGECGVPHYGEARDMLVEPRKNRLRPAR